MAAYCGTQGLTFTDEISRTSPASVLETFAKSRSIRVSVTIATTVGAS